MKSDSSPFFKASSRPTLFGLKDKNYEEKNPAKTPKEKDFEYKEKDLHALLVKYLFESEEFNLYCKTISHEKSSRGTAGEHEWLHPDIVGVHFPFKDYEKNSYELFKNLGEIHAKIYSFELKRSLNFANLRASYFQAVSNSSWANAGYLVTAVLDESILSELLRLNSTFGIGLIRLDLENLEDSEILFRAREKYVLDKATLDLLVETNKDFKYFINSINQDINVGQLERIVDKNYDLILSDEELASYLKEKIMKK